jgi:hypothetical protein
LACRDSAAGEAAERGSRFNALNTALERRLDGVRFPRRPLALSRCACLRVRAEVLRPLGCDNSTPARRAFERPMAIACVGRAVLPFANVVHLFTHEFAGLGAGRFAFLFVSLRSFNYFLLWHVALLDKFEMSSCWNLLSGL